MPDFTKRRRVNPSGDIPVAGSKRDSLMHWLGMTSLPDALTEAQAEQFVGLPTAAAARAEVLRLFPCVPPTAFQSEADRATWIAQHGWCDVSTVPAYVPGQPLPNQPPPPPPPVEVVTWIPKVPNWATATAGVLVVGLGGYLVYSKMMKKRNNPRRRRGRR